jgi:hypothetical protein
MSTNHFNPNEQTTLYGEHHFNLRETLFKLKHYLPTQAPLKDFISQNQLQSFQNYKFYKGIFKASEIFGYTVLLSLDEFRELYKTKRINDEILNQKIISHKGANSLNEWKEKLINKKYDTTKKPRIGLLRANWKSRYHIDLDLLVHPALFRILASYIDQGIAIWNFPVMHKGFLTSIRELEKNSFSSFFKTERAKKIFLKGNVEISHLLKILVGDEQYYTQYLFDQQFAHQGWSGMIATIEHQPESLVDEKKISLHDLILFELLLEIDALDYKYGETWAPLGTQILTLPEDLFADVPKKELNEVMMIWQDAYEWSYYDQVLAGLTLENKKEKYSLHKSFQAMFCIDDRECSIRRHVEQCDCNSETFGTPGFFGVEFYFKPEHAKSLTKLCPAPVTPKYLIKEIHSKGKRDKDIHFTKHSHSLLTGWLIAQTLGFWSAIKLFFNIFKPSMSAAAASSFKHMDKLAQLTIENKDINDREHDLQVGFTIDEMTIRVENLLMSIGLIKDFAPIVYLIGHGSSTINNPHYAAYDCGACSGRPGSVNARVFAYMANHSKVRQLLALKGIIIPESTQFLGGLQDTTRDDMEFYDEDILTIKNKELHKANQLVFNKALDNDAKERSRRFESIDTHLSAKMIHDKVRARSVSLFEPRPEYTHPNNALCIIGRRPLSKGIFLDRRAFMNSYDYRIDPEGKHLFNVIKPIGPVCGGMNLGYFFSKVDNHKLGAGTKLPHNVIGLIGVANGTDGDLRHGFPNQMVEIHEPIRLLLLVEHFPEIVLKTIQTTPETYEWYINEWIHVIAIHPETKEYWLIKNGKAEKYNPLIKTIETKSIDEINVMLESTQENLPIYLIK